MGSALTLPSAAAAAAAATGGFRGGHDRRSVAILSLDSMANMKISSTKQRRATLTLNYHPTVQPNGLRTLKCPGEGKMVVNDETMNSSKKPSQQHQVVIDALTWKRLRNSALVVCSDGATSRNSEDLPSPPPPPPPPRPASLHASHRHKVLISAAVKPYSFRNGYDYDCDNNDDEVEDRSKFGVCGASVNTKLHKGKKQLQKQRHSVHSPFLRMLNRLESRSSSDIRSWHEDKRRQFAAVASLTDSDVLNNNTCAQRRQQNSSSSASSSASSSTSAGDGGGSDACRANKQRNAVVSANYGCSGAKPPQSAKNCAGKKLSISFRKQRWAGSDEAGATSSQAVQVGTGDNTLRQRLAKISTGTQTAMSSVRSNMSSSIPCIPLLKLRREPRRNAVAHQPTTVELLDCFGTYVYHRCCKRVSSLAPGDVVLWLKKTDKTLLLQGWQEVSFINPANVVFVFMLVKEAISETVKSEHELRSIVLTCLYLSYSYMGNEISYPLKPFIVDSDRDQFWDRCLSLINKHSDRMLRINSCPAFFTELYNQLKAYSYEC